MKYSVFAQNRLCSAFAVLLILGGILSAKPLVLVSIAPQMEAVEAICGSIADVRTIVPTGASPETYSPSPREMMGIAKAQLLLTIGVPFETALIPKIHASFPKLKIVDCHAEMAMLKMHDGFDPHVWLSVSNMIIHADNAASALASIMPEHSETFKSNASSYKQKLVVLQERIATLLNPLQGKTVLEFHPAAGYMLNDFGIAQLSVEHHGKDATAKHLSEIADTVKKLQISTMFLSPQSNRKNAEATAQILHLSITIIDPLPAKYIQGMTDMAESIAEHCK